MKKDNIEKSVVPEYQTQLKELTSILIKHHGVKEGVYEASINFAITVGGVNGPDGSIVPGVAAGIVGIGLIPSNKENPNAIDASTIKQFE